MQVMFEEPDTWNEDCIHRCKGSRACQKLVTCTALSARAALAMWMPAWQPGLGAHVRVCWALRTGHGRSPARKLPLAGWDAIN